MIMGAKSSSPKMNAETNSPSPKMNVDTNSSSPKMNVDTNSSSPKMNAKIVYASLPSPSVNAKTVLLAAELEAQDPKYNKEEVTIRECMFKYAMEAETKAQRCKKQRGKNQRGNVNNTNEEEREHIKNKTPALGSDERLVRSNGNYGFFSTILEAYNNHSSVRTCAEDWWYTIIQRVAMAIDDNSGSRAVRDFFVSHEGKKTLTVEVGPSIYGVDYSWFLDQMTIQIAKNINVPNYVDLLKANFSTSTKTHIIVSEITTMASLQKYFEYEMMTMCGIPSLEMEGDEEDWKLMKSKFLQLKDLLKPIHQEIGLMKKWWDSVERICDQLINAFNGKPDIEWWSHIFTFEAAWGSGADTYDGWFISELLGLGSISSLSRIQSGIITVPMKISDGIISEDSTFAAGIAGFEMFKEKDSTWPSVKAAHGWTLMLEQNSSFREDLAIWESELVKGA